MIAFLTAFGVPALQIVLKLLPILYQFKLLKDEAQLKELQRRYQAAIKEAEAKAKAPVDVRGQAERAREEAKKKARAEL